MEIVTGKITDFHRDGTVTISARLPDVQRACLRLYDEVQVGLADNRLISPEQRRKAYALMAEIANWSGESREQVKLILKRRFLKDELEKMEQELFSLADCDVTTAKEFITYLIDFILAYDIPTAERLSEMCDDIPRYVYSCTVHKKCAVCGRKADLHHVDRVGMGRDRDDICHIGMQALPLCREHHMEAHQHGDERLMDKYHLEPITIDSKIAKLYRLGKKEEVDK